MVVATTFLQKELIIFFNFVIQVKKVKNLSYSLSQFLMLLVCVVYFFIAVVHIAYLPNLNTTGKSQALSHNSIFKRKTEKLSPITSLLQRIDKSTLENKQSITAFLSAALSFFTLLLFSTQLWKFNPKPSAANYPLKDYQYSYISFRSFRI